MRSLSLFVFLLLAAPTAGHASGMLTLIFSMDPDGIAADTISGYATGLSNGTNQDPTEIFITASPASYGAISSLTPTMYLSTNAAGTVSTGTTGTYGFDISGNVLLSATDIAFEDALGNEIGFNYYSTYDAANGLGTGYDGVSINGHTDYAQQGIAGITYSIVPEPRQWALFVLMGMMGIALLRKILPRVRTS